MTTYAWPTTLTPNDMVVDFVSNAAIYNAPFSGVPRGQSRDAELIRVAMTFKFLRAESQTDGEQTALNTRSTLMGFLAKLNGPEHRVTLPMFAANNLGSWTGTPLVNGSNQVGKQLNIDSSGTGAVTAYAFSGDWFTVNGELKMVTETADMNSSDEASLKIWPPLRTSPSDNAAITHASPTGTFMLESDPQWRLEPGPNGKPFGTVTVSLIEDAYA